MIPIHSWTRSASSITSFVTSCSEGAKLEKWQITQKYMQIQLGNANRKLIHLQSESGALVPITELTTIEPLLQSIANTIGLNPFQALRRQYIVGTHNIEV